jgi:hypothetical protein
VSDCDDNSACPLCNFYGKPGIPLGIDFGYIGPGMPESNLRGLQTKLLSDLACPAVA